MNFQYGIAPLTCHPSTVFWKSSLDDALELIQSHTERCQLSLTIRKRKDGSCGDGELYMTFPFNPQVSQTLEEMDIQVKRIISLKEQTGLCKNDFINRMNEIRNAYFSKL